MTVDVAVVGGGIVGLATARALALRGRSVVVLEREPRPAAHQSTHNSGVIHQGVYYAPGSLKARLCREGADRLYDYCAGAGIRAERCGKLVIAVRDADLPRLDELERRSRANGVPEVARVGGDEIAAIEPAATGLAALHSPHTGMVDYGEVARAFAADVEANGGEIRCGVAVHALREEHGEVAVIGGQTPSYVSSARWGQTPSYVSSARWGQTPSYVSSARGGQTPIVHAARAVACAGAWSDRLAAASGARPDVRIVPFRGAYLRLVPDRAGLVRGQIYPVPDPELPFLGVHFSRTIHGDVIIGPTALLAGARDAYSLTTVRRGDLGTTLRWPGTVRMVRRFWRTGLREIVSAASPRLLVREARRYVPALEVADVRPGPAGIRAQAMGRDGALLDDFLIARTGRAMHVLNAPSPAATASLAIGEMVATELER